MVRRRASCSWLSLMRSCQRRSTSARSVAGRAHQPCRARSATATARRTSSGVAEATWATLSPLAGSRDLECAAVACCYPLAINEEGFAEQAGSAEIGHVAGDKWDERLS